MTNLLLPQQAFTFISVDCVQDCCRGDLYLLLFAVMIIKIFISANCRHTHTQSSNIRTHHNRLKYIRLCRRQWRDMRTAGPCRSYQAGIFDKFLTDPTDMPRSSPGVWDCMRLWLDKAVCVWMNIKWAGGAWYWDSTQSYAMKRRDLFEARLSVCAQLLFYDKERFDRWNLLSLHPSLNSIQPKLSWNTNAKHENTFFLTFRLVSRCACVWMPGRCSVCLCGLLNIKVLTVWKLPELRNITNTTEKRNMSLCVSFFSLSVTTPKKSYMLWFSIFAPFNFHQGKPSVKKVAPNSFPLCHLLPPYLFFLHFQNIYIPIKNTLAGKQYQATFWWTICGWSLAHSWQVALWLIIWLKHKIRYLI